MTKQVQLSDRAYRILKSKKKPAESFSDVIVRSFAPKGDPRALFGLGRLDPQEAYLARMRDADRRRLAYLRKGR